MITATLTSAGLSGTRNGGAVTMNGMMNTKAKQVRLEGFGDTLAFAEYLGWLDTMGDNLTVDETDALEQEALAFIADAGWEILI